MDLNIKYYNRLTRILHLAEEDLAVNLMPFWSQNTWDAEYGGFLTRLDRCGNRLDDSEKILMMQVRMICSLSAAHRHGLNDRGYLELADKGFEYLIDTMWDKIDGGFFFSVTRDGKPTSTRKNTDFHGYVMTALSEYYLASGRAEALDYANRVFHLLREKAADRDLGYVEDFDGGEWGALNDDQMSLGGQKKIKTIDMHTNVLEGMLYLAKASKATAVEQALHSLLELICARGIYHDYGCTVTAFDYDWKPVGDMRGQMTTSYGLNVELAWLMLETVDVLGESRDKYRRAILGVVDHALEFGFDHSRGGLAAYGPLTGPVLDAHELPLNRLLKTWWAQSEMINALIDSWMWTEESGYLTALIKLFDWVQTYQIDHECGDWYQEVDWETGQPVTTDKGNEFKTAFHASRALIRLTERISSI